MSDLQQLLREAAGRPTRDLDLERVRRRGRQLRASRAALWGTAALLAVVAVVGVLGPFDRDAVILEPGTPSPPASPEPREQIDQAGPCPQPALEPSYLPWLSEGEPAGGPDGIDEDSDTGAVTLTWAPPHPGEGAPPPGPSLSLVRSRDHPEPADPTSVRTVEVRGSSGQLSWDGEPGTGTVAVSWEEDDGRCAVHTALFRPLTLGADREAREEELLRIVEDLTTTGS